MLFSISSWVILVFIFYSPIESWFLFLFYARLGPVVFWSEAIRENQNVTVLLHRVDEELLHILHSNTSKKSADYPLLKFLILNPAPETISCRIWDVRIIALCFRGKKWDNWLLIGRYWLLWIEYESIPYHFMDSLWIIYGYVKLFSWKSKGGNWYSICEYP